jgi:DNA replication protein DnaC
MSINSQIASTCPARAVCKMHNIACDVTCAGYTELQYQLKLSQIPARFQSINGKPASVEAACELLSDGGASVATYRAAAKQILNGGQTGIYLWSNMTGTGKSTAATALGCDFIVNRVGRSLRLGKAQSKPYCYYVSMPAFLERVKQMYKEGNEAVLTEVNDIQERMVEAQLLICDDIGVTFASDSVQERLLAIIEQRYDKPTIYSSNCNLNNLEERLGSRIVSRIHGTTVQIHQKGIDHRKEAVE